jgi:hypothetical protein
MADNENDKPGGEHASINDSDLFLQSTFREELKAIAAQNKKKTAAKTSDKTSAPKMPKSPAQGKGSGRKKVRPETGTEKRKIMKNYPVSEDQVDKPGKVASNTDTSLRKEVGEKTAPQIKEHTPEDVRPEEGIKIKELKGGKVGFGGNLAPASRKLKVALVSVLLVAAVAFMLSSLGVVDFGQLLGLSEPARKAGRKTSVARKPPAKKSTRVAAKSTQKITNNKASEKATAPKRKRIVGVPSEATPSKESSPVIKSQTKPDTSTKKPIIVQEHSNPSASTEEPVVAGQLPKPMASTQKEVVSGQPVGPATTAQELPMGRAPAEPVGPTQKRLVAKKPPEPSAPKVQPFVTKAVSRSAEQTPEKAAHAKGNVFSGERDLSYPYSVYLGSYNTRERAERAISEYRNKGLFPYWVKVDLGDKGVWYRVFSGYFQTREQANEFIKKKQIVESKSRHTRYANLIGLFAFQKALDEEKIRLSKLGYCPYIIPSRNGGSLLYVGAFYQKARAQRQHAELSSKGIHSQIVER